MPHAFQRLSRRRIAAVVLLAGLLASVPIAAFAVASFTDVAEGSTYFSDVEALKAAGVTTGCTATTYCPKAYVTREQMAAFLNRLGALSLGKNPVVNADKLDGYQSNDFSRAASAQTTLLKDASATTTASMQTGLSSNVPGIITINASSNAHLNGTGGDEFTCRLLVNGIEVTGSKRIVDLNWPDASHDLDDATCSTGGAYVVCLTGANLIKLDFTGLGPNTVLRDSSLTAMITPFDQGGQSYYSVCSD